MAKFITAREAARLIPNGATVGVGGMGLSGWPEEIAQEIAANYKEEGLPKDLHLKQGCAMGDWGERGITRLGIEGLVRAWDAAHIGSAFALCDLARANKIQCHCLPQGVIIHLWREIASHRPGIMTKVGMGTFVDPRVEGGRMNEATKEDICELVNFKGEDYLFYKSFPLNVALLRGTAADEDGNITFTRESIINEGYSIAAAAKNSGGIVIVQVEWAAKRGTFKPKDVRIPGIMVDYVVVATKQEACWQAEGVYYEPAFSGEVKKPLNMIKFLDLNERKIIARRCAMELRRGNITNLGVGISADVANIAAEEGYSDAITLTAESGMVGGVPSALPNFGSSYNPQATIEHGSMFDFIDGGGMDMSCLGIGQADEEGNINVSKMGTRLTGPGGLINICDRTKKLVFCGTLMNKAKFAVGDGKITVVEEGNMPKFIQKVDQITFSGKYKKPEQEVMYVTERCVFNLIDGKMTITEIAPGIDLQKDILQNLGFKPEIAKDLKVMDERIFFEKWGGLGEYVDSENK